MGRVNLGRWLKGSDGDAAPADTIDKLIATAVLRAADCDDAARTAIRSGRYDAALGHRRDAWLLRESAAGAYDAFNRN